MPPVFATWTYFGKPEPAHHLCVHRGGVLHSSCGMIIFPSRINADVSSGELTLEDKQPSSPMCRACASRMNVFIKDKLGGKKPKARPVGKVDKIEVDDSEYFGQVHQDDEPFTLEMEYE